MTPTVIILLGAAILFFWAAWTGNDPVAELKKLLGKAPSTNTNLPSGGPPNTGSPGAGPRKPS